MPRLEKFSEKSWRALLSQNLTWRGLESEEDDAPETIWETIRERERERERERRRRVLNNINIKIREEWYVCIKNAWTCDMQQYKHHELSPIQTYQHIWFQHIKHTSKMHEILWKCKCDAMHKQIGSFKHNPTQKLYKNLKNFENPQKTFKNPKNLGKKEWNAWWMREKGSYHRKKTTFGP